MAEVLEFNDMMYTNFEPKMKNRFIFEINGIPAYLIRTATRPTIQFEVVTLDHINVKTKSNQHRKGKTNHQYNSISMCARHLMQISSARGKC